jgi:uncharacterized protein (DUF2252 family)
MMDLRHPTLAERAAEGTAAREAAPLSAHGDWSPWADRPDPVSLLEQQEAGREPDLVPTRHGRMMRSPFAFFRGAAKVMTADLEPTPRSGLVAQLCGDAHLGNFGAFGSPERSLVFDLNDFDETLPGPFEYDVKRLVASVAVVAGDNGLTKSDARAVCRASATAYRAAMVGFAEMRTMDVWYAHLSDRDLDDARLLAKTKGDRKELDRVERAAERARERDSLQALSQLGELVNGRYRIVSRPPVLVPERELPAIYGIDRDTIARSVREQFEGYTATLDDDRRRLLERFRIVDVARKVVGVGSVGTRSYIALLQGRDERDPLFLQVKEASPSVLEDHLPHRVKAHGERVVQGQRLMQAVSDIFLGWSGGPDGRHSYWRQLRDMKGSVPVQKMSRGGLTRYVSLCSWTLARAHARSGDPVAMAAYMGGSDRFDRAVTRFALRYAEQNRRDYDTFLEAIASGRLEAAEGV